MCWTLGTWWFVIFQNSVLEFPRMANVPQIFFRETKTTTKRDAADFCLKAKTAKSFSLVFPCSLVPQDEFAASLCVHERTCYMKCDCVLYSHRPGGCLQWISVSCLPELMGNGGTLFITNILTFLWANIPAPPPPYLLFIAAVQLEWEWQSPKCRVRPDYLNPTGNPVFRLESRKARESNS